jgi:Na+/H+ antiporter NhaA
MEPKPKTMAEALQRLRDATRNGFASTFGTDLADALEILVILGKDTDSRDLDRDVTSFRG